MTKLDTLTQLQTRLIEESNIWLLRKSSPTFGHFVRETLNKPSVRGDPSALLRTKGLVEP